MPLVKSIKVWWCSRYQAASSRTLKLQRAVMRSDARSFLKEAAFTLLE